MNKEMVGGCCVCSDERGWHENPLVYCDGVECNVAVHQACYGIVSVPSGPWYCEKCLSNENTKVKCELCPMREGAVKHTDNEGWAHVVCALYIPEVRFGNVTTMDPIILSGVPPERYSKTCYICENKDLKERAAEGACMQCNKAGCKSTFHVTCAQIEGLLCEESGQLDNIKYCGYCGHHFKKLKKDPTIKAVPPYKPSTPNNAKFASPNVNDASPTSHANKETPNRVISTKNCRASTPTHHNGGTTQPTANVAARGVQNCVDQSSSTTTTATFDLSGITARSSTISVANHNGPSTTMSFPMSITSASASSNNALAALSSMNASVGDGNSHASTLVNNSGDATRYHSHHASTAATSSSFVNTFVPASSVNATINSVITMTTIATTTNVTMTTTTASLISSTSSTSGGRPLSKNINSTTTSADPSPSKPTAAVFTPPTPLLSSSGGKSNNNNSKDGGSLAATTPTGQKRRSTTTVAELKILGVEQQQDSNLNNNNNNNNVAKDGKVKKPRRSSSKKFESLLNLVSPVVEDTVSSFQREKVASQRLAAADSAAAAAAAAANSSSSMNVMCGGGGGPMSSAAAANSAMLSSTINLSLPSVSGVGGLLDKKLPSSSTLPMSADMSDANYLTSVCNLIGPPRPSLRNSMESHNSAFPTSLEQLLERQWEQGSQFLMEQAQHFDIASLLSCLHQLKIENQRLEDHIVSLIARRDHLLAVNARLSLPLGQQHTSPHSPRVNPAIPVLQQGPSTSHEYSLESSASANSALSRVAAAVVSNSVANPTPKSTVNLGSAGGGTSVVSPPIGGAARSAAAAGSNMSSMLSSSAYALLGGGGGGGVFTNVKHKVPLPPSSSTSHDLSPDRQQQSAGGSGGNTFVVPQMPTAQNLAAAAAAAAEHMVRSHTPLLPPQFSLTQEHHQQMLYQLMQHQAYNNALSGLIQPTSPHRAAAAVAALSQSHLIQTPPSSSSTSTQSKS